MSVPLTLKVFKGDELVISRDYDRDIIKIGRLSSAHLCLDDERVSRIHSVIEAAADGTLSIIDMGSVEGTFVNGKRINKSPLAFGDQIKVGDTVIRVESATVQPAADGPVTTVAAVDPALLAASDPQAGQAVLLSPPTEVAPVAAAPVRMRARAQEEAALAPRPKVKKSGPLGAEIRFSWGDQILDEFFLRAGEKPQAFKIGSAEGVNFLLDDAKLGGPSFDLVRSDGGSFEVRFTGKMPGELIRDGERFELKQVIEAGKAGRDDGAYAVRLQTDDVVRLQLGHLTAQVSLQPAPKRVLASFSETVDYAALNIFLVLFFLAGLVVVTAVNREDEGAAYADELSSQSRIVAIMVRPQAKSNPFLERLAKRGPPAPAQPKAVGKEGDAGKRGAKEADARMAPKAIKDSKDEAREVMARIGLGGKGGAISTIFGKGEGGEFRQMLGNLTGKVAGDSSGLSGLGLKGGGGGGGGTGRTFGLSGIATSGRAGGNSGYGVGSGIMGGKKSADISISSALPQVMGSIDPELIRRVIHSHRDQVRACYEMELQRFPKLAGKVKVKFIINDAGLVAQSSVADSDVGNPTLDNCITNRVKTWIFPKPKGGGIAIVSYPFVFRQSGG
ncbi:MAG: adventurous gliding motility protein GltG [Myxococcaceae bacterium]